MQPRLKSLVTLCAMWFAPGAFVRTDAQQLAVAVPEAARVVEPVATPEPGKRYPLRGVITAVVADRSALMVKHEAIPGVMRAMTMLFRVDEATLKKAEVGQTITAILTRESDEWWLRDVKAVTPPAK